MTKTETQARRDAPTEPGRGMDEEGAHTELRRAGRGPRARTKDLPEQLRDDVDGPDADDPFNDMPV